MRLNQKNTAVNVARLAARERLVGLIVSACDGLQALRR
jgi:hypothetical protein